MANNGYKQATVAYKTDQDGNPVDINGQLTSVSGRRQAIAVLQGRANPNPSLYEIELYYALGALINGTPTTTYDVSSCPYGYIIVSPLTIILSPTQTSGTIYLESSNAWELVSAPSNVRIDTTQGSAGVYEIVASAEIEGQGEVVFKNNATGFTAKVWVAYLTSTDWVLLDGTWNNRGVWYDNEIWNF